VQKDIKIIKHCSIPFKIKQQLDSNSIVKKWDVNWWKKYWKFYHGYDVGKKKLKKYMDLKRHLFMPLYLKMG